MSKYFLYITILYSSYTLLTSCASPSSPTGGPRDTIPPIRILTLPEHKTINYKGTTVIMEYDERLKTEKLKDQLIITPRIEFDYEYMVKKNTIKLTFEEPFLDSTTYTLNFRESIQDITEGNPTKDNKFTFSTGSYIDSLSISGYVKELLTYDTLKQVTVGLYKANDTITIFNGSPYYFTELDEDGKYLIENIKNGKYLLYAFKDDNKNLTLETDKETYGFAKDTLQLDSGEFTKNIDLIRLNLNEMKLMTALASGQYFDINLNKYIVNYTVTPIEKDFELISNLAKENKTIRFYNNFEDTDSLLVSFTALDSIATQVSDTLYIKFAESRRKKEEFKINILPEQNSSIKEIAQFEIEFNKPITSVNTDSMFIQFDTTHIANIHDSMFHWNITKDHLSFELKLDKTKADTIYNRRRRKIQQERDSLQSANEKQDDAIQQKKQMAKNKKEEKPKINSGLQLYLGAGSFLTADKDTSEVVTRNYKFLVPEEYGIQELTIDTPYESFILQLTTERFEIVREAESQNHITFKNIKPGKYKIRVLIDENNDGIWSPGNMKKQIEPEPVYIYPDVLVIRADWQTTLDLSF